MAKPVEREANGHFKKGTSGNPAGRPKRPVAIREMADKSLEELWRIATDPNTRNRDKADIYKWIYEQAYGKATQRIAGDDEGAPIIAISMISPDLAEFSK